MMVLEVTIRQLQPESVADGQNGTTAANDGEAQYNIGHVIDELVCDVKNSATLVLIYVFAATLFAPGGCENMCYEEDCVGCCCLRSF